MIGRIVDGRYLIQSLVAIGGMGRVYKAEQLGLGRTVAIKVLSVDPARRTHDPHFLERFAREAATASRLASPNTITIFHYGQTDDDIYYIVMEYVEGITLGRLLKSEGRLSIVQAVTIAGQVCLSLREAHARGIVHRDIKPTNIILVNGDYDQVKVLDFGIAKNMVREDELDQELTSSGSYVGTPEYLAPESLDGRVDSRSDIYSVGVMLYRAVTGRLPFKGKTATQTLLLSLHSPAPAIDPALGVPVGLEELIYACLEKDPELRPASVEDVLRALQQCLAEAKGVGHDGQVAAAPGEATGGAVEPPADEPLADTQFFQMSPSTVTRRQASMARAWRFLAVTVLLSAGAVAAAWVFRVARDDNDVSSTPPAAPARAPTRAAAAPPPVPAAPPVVKGLEGEAASPSPAPGAAAAPDSASGSAPASESTPESAPAPAPASEPEAAPGTRHTSRRPSRARADRRGKPAAAPAEPARSEREPSPSKESRPDEPVPDGYKPSPY
ncbi:MAG TPA: serine/threonine-protein kinase [Kofleriaceae bacterium]|nr:serine/threonine-protein kinase [Kofleriaceae bacterium]